MSTLHDPDKNLNTDPDLAFFFTLPGILNTVFFLLTTYEKIINLRVKYSVVLWPIEKDE